MGKVLVVNSIEKNVGVSSIALTLGEKLSYLSGVRTCIAELDYSNPSFSYILEKREKGDKTLDAIIPYLNETYKDDESLFKVIKFNSQKFKNSRMEILYGSNNQLTEEQLMLYISALKKIYDLVIIDYGNKKLSSMLINNIDMNLNIIQPNSKFIDKLLINRDQFIYENTYLIINNFIGRDSDTKHIIKDSLKGLNLIGKLPCSNTLVNNSLRGIINIEKGEYAINLYEIAIRIIKKLEIKTEKKQSFFGNLFGNKQNTRHDISVREQKKILLGQILVEKNICTENDIKKALEIQEKRIKGEIS